MVTIPAFALHRMEGYYPDPEKFDPERWVATIRNKLKVSKVNIVHFF